MRAGKLSGPLRMLRKLYTCVYGFYIFWRPFVLFVFGGLLKVDNFQLLPSTDYLKLTVEKFLLVFNTRKELVSE